MASNIIVKRRRDAGDGWLERTNPLQGLSIRWAQDIYDNARRGNFSRIQYIYNEIEQTDPVLMTCVERRAAALAGLGWKVGASAAASDGALADEQRDAVTRLAENLQNLGETIEHLGGAFFRGFAHARILRGGRPGEPTLPTGFELLDSWNFCWDDVRRRWWWNPGAALGNPGDAGMFEVPDGELVTVSRPRAIDYPALSIYIRHALAEREWGRFLERYGIPPINAIMPANMTKEQQDEFMKTLEGAADALTSGWTAGTQISYASEARGVNPFRDFIQHQERLIVLLATGGTLTSLAEAGSGTLAGNAQMDVWEQIVSRDAVVIGNALDRAVFRPYLEDMFPGRPVAARFELGRETEASPSEAFDIGAKARAAGYRIAQADLEEETGYTLEADAPGGLGEAAATGALPVPNAGRPTFVENAAKEPAARTAPNPPADADSRAILEAFVKDAGPAADAVTKLLENPTADAARDLMDRLPDLIGDESMAAVIAEAMAEEMAKTLGETEEAANSEKDEPADDYVPLTQEQAEEIYHDILAKREAEAKAVKNAKRKGGRRGGR